MHAPEGEYRLAVLEADPRQTFKLHVTAPVKDTLLLAATTIGIDQVPVSVGERAVGSCLFVLVALQ